MISPIWNESHLYFTGDKYFADLVTAIAAARRSIWIEVYIFEYDRLGMRMVEELIAAAARGVEVRLLVDGVGSMYSRNTLAERFANTPVQFSVYHPPPFGAYSPFKNPKSVRAQILESFLQRMFRRNHRKIVVIDDQTAWVGGMNISESHLSEFKAEKAWRDTAVRVRGPGIEAIGGAASLLWPATGPGIRKAVRRTIRRLALRPKDPQLLLNSTTTLRWRRNHLLLRKLRRSETRILITTAYFIPTLKLLSRLRAAARRGVDVRVLVPARADVLFMPWAAQTFYASLLRSGARVFEFVPTMLHAKSVIIDDWAMVGTSNLNHRSLLQDLEIDIVLTDPGARAKLSQQYEVDLKLACEVTLAELNNRPFWQRLLGRLALLFKHQL